MGTLVNRVKKIELFGKQVEIRENDCVLKGYEARKFKNSRVNLFIQLTNECNANCSFCEYHGKDTQSFDLGKLAEIISELDSKVHIGKINITGGEPLLHIKLFEKVLELLKGIHNSKPDIVVNTNGTQLSQLLNYEKEINSIGLSRHHYDDKLNQDIFMVRGLPTLRDIEKFQAKANSRFMLHSRCNLIKGYIDSEAQIKSYLDTLGEVGIVWAGFVTLMPLNQYCIDNEVGAQSLIESSNEFSRNQLWTRYENDKIECKCADYVYCTQTGKMIFFYNRIFCNPNLSAGQLVFNGTDLRLGFGGQAIYK